MAIKKSKGPSQIQKFRETARALEANESEEDFNVALKKVAKAPPSREEAKKPQPRKPAK
jgi:hypothetical protein